jgi:hypothetical protein
MNRLKFSRFLVEAPGIDLSCTEAEPQYRNDDDQAAGKPPASGGLTMVEAPGIERPLARRSFRWVSRCFVREDKENKAFQSGHRKEGLGFARSRSV